MPVILRPEGGSGGAGRQTFTPSESPFADIAARDTWAAANLNELFNSTTQVTEIIVDGDLYRWSGDNIPTSYNDNQWLQANNVLDAAEVKTLYESNPDTNEFSNNDESAVDSVRNLDAGRIPMATASGLENSPMRHTNNTVIVDTELQIPSGSLLLDDLLTLSEDTGFLGITNNVTGDRFSVIDSRHNRTEGSFRPNNFFLTGAQDQEVLQPDSSVQITSADFTFNYTTQLLGQTNIIEFQTYAALTNVRLRITDTVTGVAFKHIPNRAAWDNGTQGLNFPTIGNNSHDLTDSSIRLAPSRQLTFEVRADQAGFLGQNQTTPYLAIQFQPAEFRGLTWEQSILDITGDISINSSNKAAYDNKILRYTGTTNITIDVSATDVFSELERFSVWNKTTGNARITVSQTDGTVGGRNNYRLRSDNFAEFTYDGTSDWAAQRQTFGLTDLQSDWNETDSENPNFIVNKPTIPTARTDEEIRDLVGTTLVAGSNVTINVDDAANTITISSSGGGGGTNPPADADRIYYGLSSSSDTTTIDVTTLTRENDPTNPDTISSGTATQGQYFVLYVPMTHDLTSIFDTVLQQNVTSIFTSLDNAQTVDTISFKSYIIGALNAGFNEQYAINF